ncbi:MAG: hypothetical protein JWM84_2760 [Nocardioides sp.]|nr:hypothetical protein [Nocardioides sp.]
MTIAIADLLRGAVEIERTPRGLRPHRLTARALAQAADPQLASAEEQPSGVRLAFRTAASAVELDVVPTKRVYVGAPPRPDGVYTPLAPGPRWPRAWAASSSSTSASAAAPCSTSSPRARSGTCRPT